MAKFNHAFDFAFEVISDDFYAKDVTPAMLRAALLERANRLSDEGLMEACDCYDTYKMGDDD